MKLITNLRKDSQGPLLPDILFKPGQNLKEIKAAVAYCTDYRLFEYCKENQIKLDYYGRLDPTINLNLKKLKEFSTGDISIWIIKGTGFHPKVIWCDNYGAYIGSANLTESAWYNNIECGLWLTHKELKDNKLIDPLKKFFFKLKAAKPTPLSDWTDSDLNKLEKLKQKRQSNTECQLFEELPEDVFKGVHNKSQTSAPKAKRKPFISQSEKKRESQDQKFWEELKKEIEKRNVRPYNEQAICLWSKHFYIY